MTAAPSKTSGTYNSVVGGIGETIGNAIGSTQISQSGKDQKASGDAEYKAAQAKEYVDATADRVAGKVSSFRSEYPMRYATDISCNQIDHVVGAVTGDTAKEASGKLQHDVGVAKQGNFSLLPRSFNIRSSIWYTALNE
ncbi:hypothetical protein P7C70_g4205, partial [Phenoliferia sp. Uapishka_3]